MVLEAPLNFSQATNWLKNYQKVSLFSPVITFPLPFFLTLFLQNTTFKNQLDIWVRYEFL